MDSDHHSGAEQLMPLILHVEDDPDDAHLFARAFAKSGMRARLLRVRDGSEAVGYLQVALQALETSPSAFLPEIILLDLKMPNMDGFQFLEWIKSQPMFSEIPVLVLSSSELPADIEQAKALGASGYFGKTARFQNVIQAVAKRLQLTAETVPVTSGMLSQEFTLALFLVMNLVLCL